MKNPERNLQAILAAFFPFRPSQWPSGATLKHAFSATLHVPAQKCLRKDRSPQSQDLTFPRIEVDIGCAPLNCAPFLGVSLGVG